MEPYPVKRPQRYRRNGRALFMLVLLGCGIVFFGIVLIACSFVVNYAEDFEASATNAMMANIESKVQSEFHFTQYWAGVPFLVTGILVICSGAFQFNRGLTITTAIFCIISVFIMFFVISLDGGNWRQWNSWHRTKTYWNGKSGVDCTTVGATCVCKSTTATMDTLPYECDEISELSSLYGATVGSAIMVALFCVFSILIITKTLSWKRIIRHSHRSYYNDDYHMDNGRRTPSFIDLPYAKRGEFVEGPAPPPAGPPYKQTIYRNYPY